MISITEEEYHSLCSDYGGFCLSCKEEAFNVEPDARKYECDNCGEKEVYGIEELLFMGKLEIE